MNIQFSVKRLGKKSAYINNKTIFIDMEPVIKMAQLIERIVENQVDEFNDKRKDKSLFSFLSTEEVDLKSETGKVDFGVIYNDDKVDIIKAKETVLQAFEDGLIAIFIDDHQKEKLEEVVQLKENTPITFIRLTFLAGSIW